MYTYILCIYTVRAGQIELLEESLSTAQERITQLEGEDFALPTTCTCTCTGACIMHVHFIPMHYVHVHFCTCTCADAYRRVLLMMV